MDNKNLVHVNALPYIDVTPPYFALRDLTLLPAPSRTDYPSISATFRREQVLPPQYPNSICTSELSRHTAILGSVAAAYSNPVKAKHYYLALEALAEFEYFTKCQEMLAEARVTSARWAKARVSCEIKIYTPKGKPAGTLKVTYAIVTEPQLLKILKPMDSNRVLGTAWQPGEPSPYENPFILRMVKTHSPNYATAIISLHDRRSMAGHFSPMGTVPIAILCSNGGMLCRQLLGPGQGKRWLDTKSLVKCKRLAVAGEIIEVRARKHDQGEYTHRVEFWDEEGKILGMVDHKFVEIDVDKENKETARL